MFGQSQNIGIREKYLRNRECSFNSLSRDEIYELFLNNGYKFPGKRADDLFTRSNSDGDNTISSEEFIHIYLRELEDANEKRKKLAENMVRLRNRNRGYCHKVTRLFIKSDVKTIASSKNLDSYNEKKLNDEMIELQDFADKLEKKK